MDMISVTVKNIFTNSIRTSQGKQYRSPYADNRLGAVRETLHDTLNELNQPNTIRTVSCTQIISHS